MDQVTQQNAAMVEEATAVMHKLAGRTGCPQSEGYSRPSGSFCSPALLIRRNQKVNIVDVMTINSE